MYRLFKVVFFLFFPLNVLYGLGLQPWMCWNVLIIFSYMYSVLEDVAKVDDASSETAAAPEPGAKWN